MALAILAKNGIPPDQASAMTEEALLATLDVLSELSGKRPAGGEPDADGKVRQRYVNTRRKPARE
ncbi:MAG: hypothetical protein Q8O79_00790 [Pseudomonadota bacterium]|nr:hypothetical protein [Pseudomonadota bacterium]